MTEFEKLTQMKSFMEDDESSEFKDDVLVAFLNQAKAKILNRRYPYGKQPCDVEPKYEWLQIELAIVLFKERGAEGQASHSENGVSRSWRSVDEILNEITPYVGVFHDKPCAK